MGGYPLHISGGGSETPRARHLQAAQRIWRHPLQDPLYPPSTLLEGVSDARCSHPLYTPSTSLWHIERVRADWGDPP